MTGKLIVTMPKDANEQRRGLIRTLMFRVSALEARIAERTHPPHSVVQEIGYCYDQMRMLGAKVESDKKPQIIVPKTALTVKGRPI